MAKFLQAFTFGTGQWDPSYRFETSWLLSPYVLFAIRALFVSLAPSSLPDSYDVARPEAEELSPARHSHDDNMLTLDSP
jgi:hypothetical protein